MTWQPCLRHHPSQEITCDDSIPRYWTGADTGIAEAYQHVKRTSRPARSKTAVTATGRVVSSSGTGSLARLGQLGRPSGAAAPRPRRRLGAAAPRAGPRVPTPGAALFR